MKRFKSLSLKKKRALAIAGMSVLTLAIVGTIAYNQDAMFFNNLFRLGDDSVEFVETFDSPENWQPCQEIPKTAIATNKNSTPRYVRMKINEYWREKDSQTSADDHETTDLPLTWTDNGVEKHYAVINTQNDDKWELKNDGWYYYKTTLGQNQSTDSLLKSVTFNCEVNTVGEIRYSVDGLAGESVPGEYAEATYHLYITFQMSDEEYPDPRFTPDCTSNILYDHIACITNGLDTNVNFANTATLALGNGNGVNTLTAHKDDEYPVYYYRGQVDNYVIFDNFCWRAVRTTGTGGVKLLYSGPVINNPNPQCLDKTMSSNGDYAVLEQTSDYRSSVPYASTPNFGYFEYKNSDVKNVVYSWYGANISGTAAAANIEDTVYCNDTSAEGDPSTVTTSDRFYFNAYKRMEENYSPSVDCGSRGDSYTTSSVNGNGILAFPVALMTADELMLAGSTPNWTADIKDTYVYPGDFSGGRQCSWTMTPYMYNRTNDYEMFGWCTDIYDKYMGGQSTGYSSVRPVISLKYGVTYTGTGARSDPYVIQ